MDHLDPTLRRLADAYGIATEFWDWQGRHILVSTETIRSVLAALGVDAATPSAAEAALAEQHLAAWRRMLPPVVTCRAGWTPYYRLCTSHTGIRWRSGSTWKPARLDTACAS